jgi:hypothetical protein
LKQGDITLVIGYPGRTQRYRTSFEVDFYVNEYYPKAIRRYEDLIAILEEESGKSEEAKIRLASTVKWLSNAYKNNQGMLEGLLRSNLVEKKREEEGRLRAYLESHPEAERKYGDVLDRIGEKVSEYRSRWAHDVTLRYMMYLSAPLRSAYTVVKWAVERKKRDMDREPGYMDRDEGALKRRLRFADRSYWEPADRRILKYFLTKAASLPEGQRIRAVDAVLGGKRGREAEAAIDAFLDELYGRSQIMDRRMELFGKSEKELRELGDPFVDFAFALEKELREAKEWSDAYDGAMERLRPKLMRLRMEAEGGVSYPDANSTMRLSVGVVEGYSPRDAVRYDYMTTLTGVVEKHRGEWPFDAPRKLIDLWKAKDFDGYVDPVKGDVPVDFLTTNDVTGGNSGSPVLNGRGELIGLVFDGNYESISADYQFDPRVTRTINVDSRYVVFVLDKFSGARSLLDELTLVR